MIRLTLLASVPLLLVPAVTLAQSPPPAPSADAPQERAEDLAPPAPSGRSSNLLRGIAFDLSVSEDESKASAEIGGYSSRSVSDAGAAEQLNLNWSLKLAVPVGGGDDLSSGSTLDALSDGASLTLNVGAFGFRSGAQNLFGEPFDRIMRDARERCASRAANSADLSDTQRPAEITRCRNAGPDPEFAATHSSYSDAAINRSLYSGIWRLGLEASVGIDRFDFIDSATLSERSRTKPQFSIGIVGALYPADAMSAVIAEVEYQNAFEAEDETVVCRAVVVTPEDDCAFGVPTAPENVERLNISVEGRRIFDSGWRRGSFAISPKGTIDALSGEFELELPVYFIPRGEWPVSPGLSLAYSSEDEEFDFGVFLRTSFSF